MRLRSIRAGEIVDEKTELGIRRLADVLLSGLVARGSHGASQGVPAPSQGPGAARFALVGRAVSKILVLLKRTPYTEFVLADPDKNVIRLSA